LVAQLFGNEEAPKMASGRGNDPQKLAKEVFKKIEQDHEQEHEHE
jgi:hypothetical protein